MKTILKLATLLALTSSLASATVLINLTAGVLSNSSGTPVADGSLIQLISSGTDSLFSAPSAASFVTGGDILLSSFALDSENESGIPGALLHPITINLGSGVATGQKLAIRWFPSLAFGAGTPGAGASYGEFTDSVTAWTIPSDGNSISPEFLTLGFEGVLSDSVGRATFNVAGAAIPEPSTYALLGGLAALGLAGWRRRIRT